MATRTSEPTGTVAFRRAMSRLPTGVTVVTVGCGEGTEAVTVSSVASISLEPMLVLASLASMGRLCGAIDRAGGFAVNVLAEDQADLSALFARHDRPRGLPAQELLGGVPGPCGHLLLSSALLSLECRTEFRYPAGDHVLFVGRVAGMRAADPVRAPLVHHLGAYTSLRDSRQENT